MTGRLTTHVLDTARGRPAPGVEIRLARTTGGGLERLCATTTNADGRTDAPLLPAGDLTAGTYELTFVVGPYLVSAGAPAPPFLDVVSVRFTVTEPGDDHHVPLLVSPWAYSVYRGS